MSSDNRNLILAVVLSVGVLFLYQAVFVAPQMEAERARQAAEQQAAEHQTAQQSLIATDGAPVAGPGPATAPAGDDADIPRPERRAAPDSGNAAAAGGTLLPRDEALAASPRVQIDSDAIEGSIAMRGGVIDDVRLKRYRETIEDDSSIITYLSPKGSEQAYYIQLGWTTERGSTIKVPGSNTLWRQVGSGPLTENSPITLEWDNGEGLRFTREIAVDENYMFRVTDRVANASDQSVPLYPYGFMSRLGKPKSQGMWILHEGFIGVFGDELKLETYGAIEDEDDKALSADSTGGWFGITDKYWLAALIPPQDENLTGHYRQQETRNGDVYRAEYLSKQPHVAEPGGAAEITTHVFAGAKKLDLLDNYQETLELPLFDYAIDWGWFFFFTIPFFYVLKFLADMTGNFGVAILIFTVLIKLLFFWPANKSYESMTKMKKVQPEMEKLRERYKEDRTKLQQEMMALYQKEKINPVAGCLPVLIQIPVFFALYKVLFVTIEMRHAPFFGWIQDLSAPDPTTMFNLFGLIPWDPTTLPVVGSFLVVGVWPLIMGISMWFQMKMNPPPPDPTQRQIFALMPYIFTFMLAPFAAGLVIYWAWNNILSILQQYVIMRRMGVEPDWKNSLKTPEWLKGLFGKKETPQIERDGTLSKTASSSQQKDDE